MIKTEKTVTDLAGRLKIVDSCDMCRLGLTDGKRVSVIPVSFGYTFLNGNFTFYMKGDWDDRVMKLLREAEEIAFQMDSDHCMLPVENGEYTMLSRRLWKAGFPGGYRRKENRDETSSGPLSSPGRYGN